MRRVLALVALGTMLMTAAACNKAADTADPAPSASSVAPNTKEVCDNFEKAADSQRMTQLGTVLGALLLARQTGDTAGAKTAEDNVKADITKLAGEVTAVGAKANDAAVKTNFDQVAANITASTDLKWLDGVTAAEFEKPFTDELSKWIQPIASVCQLNG